MTDTAAPALYAIVEIMGHRTRAGLIADAQIAGATFLRIEHPTATVDDAPVVEYYAPTSLFAVTPCSKERAEQAARGCWYLRSYDTPQLPTAVTDSDAYIEDDDFTDDNAIDDLEI